MKNTIAVIILVISFVFIIPYAIIKYILDSYNRAFNFAIDYIAKHLNVEQELQNISIYIDDKLNEN